MFPANDPEKELREKLPFLSPYSMLEAVCAPYTRDFDGVLHMQRLTASPQHDSEVGPVLVLAPPYL